MVALWGKSRLKGFIMKQEIKSKKQNKQEMKDKIKIRLKKIKPNDQTPLNPLKNNKPTKH
ncbi:hypothetical protein [Helicobacter pylori]|uniref:hypothetical protein n=1 Tax=Helicobacter pylori TaxID=210 RepID=UPI002E249C8F